MCDEESCTICLDQLFHPCMGDIITRLQPCGHYYHTECITLWTDRSNSCPTCRRDFEFVETINKSGEVLTIQRAEKKVIEHVDEFFEVYNEDDYNMTYDEEDVLERRINNMIARSNICILCDSRRGNVTPCNSCSSTFHLSCLGATNLTRWFCPMCDAEQLNFQRPISVFRRTRNSAITNRVYDSLGGSSFISYVTDAAGTTTGEAFRSSLLNGPVAMEVKENPKPISIEEQQAWEVFEMAKKDKVEERLESSCPSPSSATSSSNHSVSASSVKKLKQPSRRGIRRGGTTKNSTTTRSVAHVSTTNVSTAPSSSKSLVETILGQMKDNRSTENKMLSVTSSTTTASSIPSLSLSPSTSFSSSAGSSPQLTTSSLSTSPERNLIPNASSNSSFSNKSFWKTSIPNDKTLTLSQKSTLQELVRCRLRPLYKDGTINFDQYTAINKKVSHILYETCLNESEDFDFEQLAENHVTQEVMEL